MQNLHTHLRLKMIPGQIPYIVRFIIPKKSDFKHQPHLYRIIDGRFDGILDDSDFLEVPENGKVTEQKLDRGPEDTVEL